LEDAVAVAVAVDAVGGSMRLHDVSEEAVACTTARRRIDAIVTRLGGCCRLYDGSKEDVAVAVDADHCQK
jgi:hypothetical protein